MHAVDELVHQALMLIAVLSLPVLAAAAAAGLAIGVLASATRIHDPALAHLPRFVAVVLVLIGFGAWGGHTLVAFTHELWRGLPTLVR